MANVRIALYKGLEGHSETLGMWCWEVMSVMSFQDEKLKRGENQSSEQAMRLGQLSWAWTFLTRKQLTNRDHTWN